MKRAASTFSLRLQTVLPWIGILLLCACATPPELAYYPTQLPDPPLDRFRQTLSVATARQDAEILAAPRSNASVIAVAGFRQTFRAYAFQSERRPDGATARFALVGPVRGPAVATGWLAETDLVRSDQTPEGLVVVRSIAEAAATASPTLRAGPGPGYSTVRGVRDLFLARAYAERDGYVLLGPLPAAGTPAGDAGDRLRGWLPVEQVLRWETGLAVSWLRSNFSERRRVQVFATLGEAVGYRQGSPELASAAIYVEEAVASVAPHQTLRFPVLGAEAEPVPCLRIVLPGGLQGWVALMDPDGTLQLEPEALLDREQVASLQASLSAGRRPRFPWAPAPPAGSDLARVLAAAGRIPASADPVGVAATYLESVAEEFAVEWHGASLRPVPSALRPGARVPHPYWWPDVDGQERAWVSVAYLPWNGE